MIRPRPLPERGCIGICAPAGPVNPERLAKAVAALESEGFRVVTSPSAASRWGLFSAQDETRRRELEEMFARDDVDAVFCARGGVGSSRLLESVNTSLIAESRKPFLGFSDLTALQWLLWARHNFVTFSGPLAVEWDGSLSKASEKHALDTLMGRAGVDVTRGFATNRIEIVRESRRCRGRLMPANLTLLTTLLGTPFLPDLEGALLVIEDVGEPLYRVDRMLFHLRNAGVLKKISGLLAGELFSSTVPEENDQLKESLRAAAHGMDYTIAINLPFGHGAERMTLPVGVEAEFEPSTRTLRLCEPVFEDLR